MPGRLREPARRCGDPSVCFPFQLPLGLSGRAVKIVIGAFGQGALLFPARRGDTLPAPHPHSPSRQLGSAVLMLLIENTRFWIHNRDVGTGDNFLNLNNAHHEYTKGGIKPEERHEENARVSFFLSPQPAKLSWKRSGRGRVKPLTI